MTDRDSGAGVPPGELRRDRRRLREEAREAHRRAEQRGSGEHRSDSRGRLPVEPGGPVEWDAAVVPGPTQYGESDGRQVPEPLSAGLPTPFPAGEPDPVRAAELPDRGAWMSSPLSGQDADPDVSTGAVGPVRGVGGRMHGAPSGGHPVFGQLSPRLPETPESVRRLDLVALIVAIVVPPVGIALAVVAMNRGRVARGWPSPLARVALRLGVVMTAVFVVGAVVLWAFAEGRAEQRAEEGAQAAAHAAIVEESRPFCEAVAAAPVTMFGDGVTDHGWPAETEGGSYREAISEYAAHWASLEGAAPTPIATDVASARERIDAIVAMARALPNPNRAGDLLDLHSVPDLDGVASHVASYCV